MRAKEIEASASPEALSTLLSRRFTEAALAAEEQEQADQLQLEQPTPAEPHSERLPPAPPPVVMAPPPPPPALQQLQAEAGASSASILDAVATLDDEAAQRHALPRFSPSSSRPSSRQEEPQTPARAVNSIPSSWGLVSRKLNFRQTPQDHAASFVNELIKRHRMQQQEDQREEEASRPPMSDERARALAMRARLRRASADLLDGYCGAFGVEAEDAQQEALGV